MSPRLEGSSVISAYRNPHLLGLSNSPASAFEGAGTTGMHHHTQTTCVCVCVCVCVIEYYADIKKESINGICNDLDKIGDYYSK